MYSKSIWHEDRTDTKKSKMPTLPSVGLKFQLSFRAEQGLPMGVL